MTSISSFSNAEMVAGPGLVPTGAVLYATFETSRRIPVWMATGDEATPDSASACGRRSLRAALVHGVCWLCGR